ncbi:unnamed protein product [Xylocopa violacea]|uniref:rhomboid protease n=1 Tax=Xylocopa violacea TaxID=135666 RepID=A0ABP1PAN9_XYLVO
MLKPKIYTFGGCKQIRNFNRFKGKTMTSFSKPSLVNDASNKHSAHTISLWKSFTFTVMFSGTTFIAAIIWEYKHVREKTYNVLRSYKQLRIHRTGWRRKMQKWWSSLPEGEKMFIPICFLNVLVYILWRIPAYRPTMYKYFSNSPASGNCWPMLLSTFSHYSLLHLITNMYVLHNFCPIAVTVLGREQFLAFYLTSGVVSSFSSHLYKAAIGIKDPSLGASGALMGIFGFLCTQFPNMYLSIVFISALKFQSGTAIKAAMGIDMLGCLCRWKLFDHAAHLGGALFGIFWQVWGNANIWQKREPIVLFLHKLCGPPKSH